MILVTGGCGFVGRNLVKHLLARGEQVTVIDDLSTGIHPGETPPFYFIESDVRKWFCIDHDTSQYHTIFHLAAVVGGRLKIEGDPLAVATDLAVDSDFFNWLVKGRFKGKVVYFSSSAVYPTQLQTAHAHCALSETLVDLTGKRIGMPDSTYGWSKLTGELLMKYAVETYGLDVVCYRPFSGYGEDQDFTYPFPSIMQRVAHNFKSVTVWGSGRQARDFIHIDDVVECVLTTMHQLKPGEVLNIGSGVPTTFTQLALLAGAKEVVNDITKPEGVFWRVADTYRMGKLFKPKISLAEGIERVKKAVLTRVLA